MPRRAIRTGAILLVFVAVAPTAGRRPAQADWHALVRPRDRERLRDWRKAWITALANARAGGAGARIAAEGLLLEPDAATAPPDAPDGDYRCRTIRVGAAPSGGMAFSAQPPALCRIAGGRFRMLTGGQRPAGRLWPFDGLRLVFLGATALGDESGALDYGRDPDRDAAGVLERIAPDRWRLVLPRPQWQSMLDVIELVPAARSSVG